MIVTLTMNPSVDRTATLTGALVRGGVNRIATVDDCAGGKGVNVSRVIHDAGGATLAVFPASGTDPFVDMCIQTGIPVHLVPVVAAVRVNLTVTEPDGTTTKINAPGDTPGPQALEMVRQTLLGALSPDSWVVLSGSLPPGVDPGFYADLVPSLKAAGARVAVDTSEAPLQALAAALPRSGPDLIKPNGEELGQMTGTNGRELEAQAASGDFGPAIAAAGTLVHRGVGAVLVTLGGAGAVLVSAEGVWTAAPPDIVVRSTVGAGDSSLAGYLLADLRGCASGERLAWAVAHGSAAASLPGTGLPSDLDVAGMSVTVTEYPPVTP